MMYRICFSLAVLALLFTGHNAVAQDPDKNTPPVPNLPDEPVVQAVSIETLDNGIPVVLQSVVGVDHVSILVVLRTGENHDPRRAPGLNHLLARLVMTEPVGDLPARDMIQMNEQYPAGWISQTYHDRTVFGITVPFADAAGEIGLLADRMMSVRFTETGLDSACDLLEQEIKVRFETRPLLVPTSWLVGKTFRHASSNVRGCEPDRLREYSTDDLKKEWLARIDPSNVMVVVCGYPIDDSIVTAARDAFSSFAPHDRLSPPDQVNVKPVGKVTREVRVEHLPGDKDHAAVAFYAPAITHPDHPAFLAIARHYMNRAASYPEAQGRVAFQYELLTDSRAAYLTPHAIGFPQGPQQAIDLWDKRFENPKGHSVYAKRAYRSVGYQLGADLSPDMIRAIRQRPVILYTIAYTTAFRHLYGDDAFWSEYRDRLLGLKRDEIEAAKKKYFGSDNRATFILRAK